MQVGGAIARKFAIGAGGSSSIGRALAFQAGCCGFETRLPLQRLSRETASVKGLRRFRLRLDFPPKSAENRLYSPYLMSNLLSTLKGGFRTKVMTLALA